MNTINELHRLLPSVSLLVCLMGGIVSAQVHPKSERNRSVGAADRRPTAVDRMEATDAGSLSSEQRKRYKERLLELQGLADLDLQRIDMTATERIRVRLSGEEKVLRLHAHSMRDPGFRVLVPDGTGAFVDVALPPVSTYRGRFANENETHVAASVVEGRLHAIVHAADGELWSIEPVKAMIPDAPADLYTVYRASDLLGENGSCSMVETHRMPPQGEPAPQQEGVDAEIRGSGGIAGRTEIAFDADFEFFMSNGASIENTVRDIEMVMNQVGLIYQNQVDICYAMTGIIVRIVEPDPYTSTNSSTLLCEFMDSWNAFPLLPSDVNHLMTGKDLDDTFVGRAFVGVMCNVNIANCSGGSGSFGLSQSRFSMNLTERTILTAHELGHNWSACHCNNGGCPMGNPTCCTGGPPDADCGVMCSSIGCASTTFGSRSVASITAHRDSRSCLDTCFDPVYVDWNNPLSGNGSSSNPFRTVGEGVNYVPVGGVIVIADGIYPENLIINKNVTLTVPSGDNVTIGD
ncbi:MAG: M12 family metallo-peptidase [Phycisphaerales bacterium]|nr:M12 family metallo-peptidase [Phycisphaerales bacterium]